MREARDDAGIHARAAFQRLGGIRWMNRVLENSLRLVVERIYCGAASGASVCGDYSWCSPRL
jgi:hypothetical protein